MILLRCLHVPRPLHFLLFLPAGREGMADLPV